jgi:membrane protease YdiL (CAAX protease family)
MSALMMGDLLSVMPTSEVHPSAGQNEPVTLGQAAWALMFVAIYIAVVVGVILALGLPGIIEFTLESLLLVLLTSVTAAAILALYLHLVRRNHLTPGDLGFQRPTPRLFHLLWQIPATIIICALMQALSLGLLTLTGIDTTSAGATDDPLTDIAGLPAFFAVISVLVVAVLTPLWEEVLFRGAFLDGLSQRFRPTVAIILSAALFAAIHIVPLSFAYLFTLGISLALLRRFHQNLWAPILLHAANNASSRSSPSSSPDLATKSLESTAS